MKKTVFIKVDYAGGESRKAPCGGVDYMMVGAYPDELPNDFPVDELYVEIDPEDVPGAGHYEDDEWVCDDECASEPILRAMLVEEALSAGFIAASFTERDEIVLTYETVDDNAE